MKCALHSILLALILGSNFSKSQKNERRKHFTSSSHVIDVTMRGAHFFASFPLYRSHCQTIPSGFNLCHGMEYTAMRLPNLLGHETMDEVKEQASSWPPLVSNGCHQETRKFLCSLYAPVCMPGYGATVPPCRSLCESVRDACSPTMKMFGYSWPSMFNCTAFPHHRATGRLCIPGGEKHKQRKTKLCPPCRRKRVVSIKKKLCSFDFVMKARVRRFKFDQGSTRILTQPRSRKVYKWGASVSKRCSLWLNDGLHCTCNVIKNTKRRYLVTGWQIGENLVLHSITRWRKKYKKLMTKLKRCK